VQWHQRQVSITLKEAERQRRDLMAESTRHAGGKLQERTWRNSVDRYTNAATKTAR
jgi:hypothetical protein